MPFLASIEGQFAFGRQPVTTQSSTGIVTQDLLLYLDSGNVASYPGTGTTWTDLSSNGNNATSLTGFTYSSSNSGIISFNGTSGSGSLVSSEYNTTYTGKTVFVSGSLLSIAANTYRAMLGSSADNRNFNFYFYCTTSNTYQLHFSAANTGSLSTDLNYVLGNWFTVAVTQATNGTTVYYLNGVQVNQTTQTFSQYLSPSTEFVGRADNYWNGPLPVITVYKTALTASQILQNHNAVITRFPVTSNLVSWFDPGFSLSYPGTGTTITDLSPNPVNGTLSNITFTNPYFTYNGSNGQVSVPDNAKLDPGSNSWSMEAWFYPTQFKTGVILGKFNNGGGSADVSYSIRTQPGGNVFAQVGDGTGSFVNSTNYQSVLSNWAQIVYVVKNTAPKSLETFVNGVSIGSVSYNTLSSLLNSSNALYLGSYNGGEYSQWFAGRIGVTRLYNTALTSTQVLQNYNADRAKYGL